MNCYFQNPINLGDSGATADWEFSEMICDEEAGNLKYELIENPETGASFYLDKSFSYGDWFLLIFLIVFVLVATIKIIFNFFWQK